VVQGFRVPQRLLGLPPLSQYDAATRPLFAAFTATPSLAPYQSEVARIDLNTINTSGSYGAARSAKMDSREYDRADNFELNEILWRSIKGKDAPLPPPVRRALAERAYAEAK
jgi:hypothetical protein